MNVHNYNCTHYTHTGRFPFSSLIRTEPKQIESKLNGITFPCIHSLYTPLSVMVNTVRIMKSHSFGFRFVFQCLPLIMATLCVCMCVRWRRSNIYIFIWAQWNGRDMFVCCVVLLSLDIDKMSLIIFRCSIPIARFSTIILCASTKWSAQIERWKNL